MVLNHTTPLLIDPNYKATEWLQNELNEPGILQSHDSFVNKLELAVRFGKTLIVREVDQIYGVYINLLRQDFICQGGRNQVKIGDKPVEFTNGFRLYLCTRDTSISLSDIEKGWVGVVNFTVTKSGLENKLLSIIINQEKPEIEQQKSECLQQEEDLKVKIAGLEEKLLQELANAKGDILQNTALIDSLNDTKKKALEIKKSLQQSKELQNTLDQ